MNMSDKYKDSNRGYPKLNNPTQWYWSWGYLQRPWLQKCATDIETDTVSVFSFTHTVLQIQDLYTKVPQCILNLNKTNRKSWEALWGSGKWILSFAEKCCKLCFMFNGMCKKGEEGLWVRGLPFLPWGRLCTSLVAFINHVSYPVSICVYRSWYWATSCTCNYPL